MTLSQAEVPDYLAWKHFFFSVDWNYRLGEGFYYGFINLRLKLGPLLAEEERGATEALIQLMADRAALINRELERFSNESRNRRRFVELGGMSETEARTADRAAMRQKVLTLQTSCESLRDEVFRIVPNSGSAIWERIVEYVLNDVKASSSLRVGANRAAYDAMLEFRTPSGKGKPERVP